MSCNLILHLFST